jgi:hypothetical protein
MCKAFVPAVGEAADPPGGARRIPGGAPSFAEPTAGQSRPRFPPGHMLTHACVACPSMGTDAGAPPSPSFSAPLLSCLSGFLVTAHLPELPP